MEIHPKMYNSNTPLRSWQCLYAHKPTLNKPHDMTGSRIPHISLFFKRGGISWGPWGDLGVPQLLCRGLWTPSPLQICGNLHLPTSSQSPIEGRLVLARSSRDRVLETLRSLAVHNTIHQDLVAKVDAP
jgi:hypothetical protein